MIVCTEHEDLPGSGDGAVPQDAIPINALKGRDIRGSNP